MKKNPIIVTLLMIQLLCTASADSRWGADYFPNMQLINQDGDKFNFFDDLIKDKIVVGGMRVKMESCIDALRSGVKRVHILNGFRKDSLRDEVYTSEGIGTMIVREEEKNIYLKQEIQN